MQRLVNRKKASDAIANFSIGLIVWYSTLPGVVCLQVFVSLATCLLATSRKNGLYEFESNEFCKYWNLAVNQLYRNLQVMEFDSK